MVRKTRVVGGVVKLINMFPFIVQIIHQNTNKTPESFCGGSLISHSWVLTAAHCHSYNSNKVRYYIGAGYSEKKYEIHPNGSFSVQDGEIRHAVLFIPHERYNRSLKENDIALYRTGTPFSKDNFRISLVNLPKKDNLKDVSDRYKACFLAGWGTTSTYSLDYVREGNGSWKLHVDGKANKKRKLVQVILPPISRQACRNIRDPWNGIDFSGVSENILCTLYYPGRKCACFGDSGSPLICGTRQYGIASWIYSCGQARRGISVFTRVDKYIDWITTKIRYMVDVDVTSEYYGLLYNEMVKNTLENGSSRMDSVIVFFLMFAHYCF